jgi:solute carrier family 25 (mitochondrial carnitine/acylcarnitine transporter), member 20/29
MESFIAGTISGIAQIISGHPFDTLKVLMQTDTKIKKESPFKLLTYKNLYRGISGPLLTNAFVIGTQFHYYHKYNSIIAGIVSGIIMTPIDFFKIQKQVNKKNFINKNILITLIKGYPITILREVSSLSIYFNTYYYLKENTDNVFLSGGIAGILSWIPTYPIDTLKTRIQQGISLKKSLKMNRLFSGFSMCITRAFIVNSIGFYFAELFIENNKNNDR